MTDNSREAIHYTVALKNPDAHLFEVGCTVVDPDPAGQSFRLPTWIPGSYLIREFARNLVGCRDTRPPLYRRDILRVLSWPTCV